MRRERWAVMHYTRKWDSLKWQWISITEAEQPGRETHLMVLVGVVVAAVTTVWY